MANIKCSFRLKLHDGVLRDVERQQRRKHENTYTLQQQIDITKQLKATEASASNVSSNSNTTNASTTPLPPTQSPSRRTIQLETEVTTVAVPSVKLPKRQNPPQPMSGAADDSEPAAAAAGSAGPQSEDESAKENVGTSTDNI